MVQFTTRELKSLFEILFYGSTCGHVGAEGCFVNLLTKPEAGPNKRSDQSCPPETGCGRKKAFPEILSGAKTPRREREKIAGRDSFAYTLSDNIFSVNFSAHKSNVNSPWSAWCCIGVDEAERVSGFACRLTSISTKLSFDSKATRKKKASKKFLVLRARRTADFSHIRGATNSGV
jgi:hypothetical protein